MRTRTFVVAVLAAIVVSSPTFGQAHEPDPKAMKAFRHLVKAYRERPALNVKTTIGIELAQDGVSSGPREVEAEFMLGRGGVGTIRLRGFTCYLGGGRIVAEHESTEHSYYSAADDGSPYYTLMAEFMDIPFPHLALAFGDPDITNLCMQFHQMAPWVQPTAVDTVTDERPNAPGPDPEAHQRIRRACSVLYDPKTKLIESVDLQVTGGDSRPGPGATLSYQPRVQVPDPRRAACRQVGARRSIPAPRQRVDMMQAPSWPGTGRAGAGPRSARAGGRARREAGRQPRAGLRRWRRLDGGAVDLEANCGAASWSWTSGPRGAARASHGAAAAARRGPVGEGPGPARRGPDRQRLGPRVHAGLSASKNVSKFWNEEGLHPAGRAMDYTNQTATSYKPQRHSGHGGHPGRRRHSHVPARGHRRPTTWRPSRATSWGRSRSLEAD